MYLKNKKKPFCQPYSLEVNTFLNHAQSVISLITKNDRNFSSDPCSAGQCCLIFFFSFLTFSLELLDQLQTCIVEQRIMGWSGFKLNEGIALFKRIIIKTLVVLEFKKKRKILHLAWKNCLGRGWGRFNKFMNIGRGMGCWG